MSEIVKDRGVILGSFDFSESSVIAVSLTMDHGKLRFLAKGARKSKSPFHGALRTGNVAELIYYDKPQRGLQLLREISSRSVFDSGSADLEKNCLFQAGLEVADRTTIDCEPDRGVFAALEEFMENFGSCLDPWAMYFALQARLAAVSGLLPDFSRCGGCKKALAGKGMKIDSSSGAVFCDSCGSPGAAAVSAASSDLLRTFGEKGPGGAAGVCCDPVRRREIGKVMHGLFLHHFDGYRLPVALRILKGVD